MVIVELAIDRVIIGMTDSVYGWAHEQGSISVDFIGWVRSSYRHVRVMKKSPIDHRLDGHIIELAPSVDGVLAKSCQNRMEIKPFYICCCDRRFWGSQPPHFCVLPFLRVQ